MLLEFFVLPIQIELIVVQTYAMMKPRLSGLGLNKTLTENQQGTTLPENFVLLEVASEVMRETLVKRFVGLDNADISLCKLL